MALPLENHLTAARVVTRLSTFHIGEASVLMAVALVHLQRAMVLHLLDVELKAAQPPIGHHRRLQQLLNLFPGSWANALLAAAGRP